MGARVAHANHLGELLTRSTPRPVPPLSAYRRVVERVAQAKSEAFQSMFLQQSWGRALQPRKLTELQKGIVAAKRRLSALGLPEGRP